MARSPETREGVPAPQNVASLLALARSVERAAADRYARLAQVMAGIGDAALADLFQRLAEEERRHEDTVVEMAGGALGEPAPIESPESATDDEIADGGGAYLITPHRALEIATQNERRAFSLFSTIAANADDPEVQRIAEALAKEELEHLSRIRLARRQAWRDEQSANPAFAQHRLEAINSIEALLARAHAIDTTSRALDRENAARCEMAGEARFAAAFHDLAAEPNPWLEAEAPSEGDADPPSPAALPQQAHPPPPGEADTALPLTILQSSLDDAERALEFYLAVAEQARDQRLLEVAQSLADRALARLNQLGGMLADAEGRLRAD